MKRTSKYSGLVGKELPVRKEKVQEFHLDKEDMEREWAQANYEVGTPIDQSLSEVVNHESDCMIAVERWVDGIGHNSIYNIVG